MPVKGITNLNNMAMINVSGPGMKAWSAWPARVFAVMSRAGISVVLITQSSSEYSISFCVPQGELQRAAALEEEFYLELKDGVLDPLDVMERLAIISVVGDGMRCVVSPRASSRAGARQHQYRRHRPGLFRAFNFGGGRQ